MLQPTVRRTWAPQGKTPVPDRWARHDRLSVPRALPVSPVRQRLGLYFSIASSNVTGNDVLRFVQPLRHHLKRPLLVIWERFSGPKQAARWLRDLYGTRIHLAELPAYAPDLNPVEQGWSHTKYGERANCIPQDVEERADEVARSLRAKHQRPALLRAFFQHARRDL